MKIEVRRSHFIGICNRADSVEEARAYLALLRQRYAEASHRVYAFAIGHGATVTHGMSDDGEPSGTAGRPVLAVLQGAGIGGRRAGPWWGVLNGRRGPSAGAAGP